MRNGILCVLLLLLAGCATSDKNMEIARLHLAIGTTYLTSGKYHASLAELLESEKLDPRNAQTQNNLGLTYYLLDHTREARDHLQKALQLDPNYTEARNNLARVDVDLALYTEAMSLVKQVLKDLTYPTPEKAWINMGLIYFAQHNYSSAQMSFRRAIEIDRKNCLALDYYGRSLYEMEKYSEAARVLDEGVKSCKDSQFDEPHYYSALSYYKLGQREKAMARLDELLNAYPNGKYVEKAQNMKKMIE